MPTFVEVCSGAGGLSLGFMNAGFEPLLLCDFDKDCCETLRKNHSAFQDKIVCKDMRTLSLKDIKPDILMGGIPCQSFSQAGKRKGTDDARGGLFFEFIRLIKECNPSLFIIENVRGLLTLQNGKVFEEMREALRIEGKYNVHVKLLNAVDYGVPQKRERVFIVGSLSKNEFEYPVPNPTKKVLRDVLLDVPANDDGQVSFSEKKTRVMELVPPGGCWVNLPEDVKKEYMGKSIDSGGGKRGIARRLSLDEPSLTLTTSPSQKQTERCHPIETRPFTVREYARIQTFPDNYVFHGSVSSRYRQIGNAVPVKLAECVAHSVKQFLERP